MNHVCPLSGKRLSVGVSNWLIMYHWYILIRNKYHSEILHQNELRLISNGDKHSYSFTDKIDSKLFWIGSLEVLPILLGVIATENVKPFLFTFDYAVIGVTMSIIVAYIFRNDVPDQPISLNNKEENRIANE